MSKKTLPKAIVRLADPKSEAGSGRFLHTPPAEEIDARSIEGTPPPISIANANVIEIAHKRQAPTEFENRIRPDDAPERRRQSIALGIVERHANFSAIGGVIPIPIVNAACVAGIVLRMLKVLSRHYGIPFERDRARKIVIGLTGGVMPTGLAAVTASTLSYIVPGSNLLGLAVCSVTASACTRGIGRMFIELFENGATWRDIQ